ncbi:MAG: NTP transferase domain-containing protein [Spirochaetales bacterium]|nr:NTP transferase domain-containing protein [Spirochaetales bacterium]
MRGIFLQVRLDSLRLPQKALLPLAGKPVVAHAMESLNRVPADHRVLLTTEDSVEPLKSIAHQEGWDIFVGPKSDVLGRYVKAIQEYGVQTVVRATGDNPLVSALLAQKALEHFSQKQADYCGLLGMPLGTGVEVVRAQALVQASQETSESYEREHVCPYLYRHSEHFQVEQPMAPPSFWGDYRLTLDTSEDYMFLSELFNHLYKGIPLDLPEILPWLQERPILAR